MRAVTGAHGRAFPHTIWLVRLRSVGEPATSQERRVLGVSRSDLNIL
ncbi:hypothetical protein G4Y79_02925 [Phototrophicus methaneseepsis]|uniref:Uncharacterized protein n=1 Tax=Phototrophicus methaneseepsis TaxID=2710758 RepID=A0A7S8EAH3_9CHLR|nr:hypothetical protein [Phototrophicus methaneseepsis]QPC83349.1 hypothetical protein G4Y79_02925 [Phototrophicus methaneseepsis]